MTRQNKKYTKEEKESLVTRLLPPESISLGMLANETGISKSTLSTWKKKAEEANEDIKPKKRLTPNDKFLIVIETYSLTEIELSRYCREKGLYYDEVKKWASVCLNSNNNAVDSENIKELKAAKQEDSKRINELEKELTRKEKALAEAAALLLLRKKLHAILVENAED